MNRVQTIKPVSMFDPPMPQTSDTVVINNPSIPEWQAYTVQAEQEDYTGKGNGHHKLDDISSLPVYVSEAEYWTHYYEHLDINYEWNNGILEEKPMASLAQAYLYRAFIKLLERYLDYYDNAITISLEIGFRLALPNNKTSVRKPDLGVVLRSNLTGSHPSDRRFNGIFDLCIESLSDSNTNEINRDTVTKFNEYQQVGVREYYILDDKKNRHMKFYRLNAAGVYEPIPRTHGGDVIASGVLPGFQFRISDLYNPRPFIQLANDPVYQGYIETDYQRERARANQEYRRAEQERLRAEIEAQRNVQLLERVNRYEEQLRVLGIDPNQL
ncbi:MAG: Uma2 family endonuclease [Chloroflexota bacterium]